MAGGRGTWRRRASWIAAVVALALAFALVLLPRLRPAARRVEVGRAVATPEALATYCKEVVGEPRILRVGDRILVAIGYDLANTILVRTDAGNVVIDAGMSPDRARAARAALLAQAPGAVVALVYTHSHIDHVGGASAWVEPGTAIWSTDAFVEHFFKQYGVFRRAESRRGAAQFGYHVGDEALPCSALGRRADVDAAARTGVRLPTRTFTGAARFEVGGIAFELHEAHGETHDQLFVWMPQLGALAAGDNYYEAFPNLYTIRGTSPRPVDAWIESLDHMRRLAPEHLVPSHTRPLDGRERIAAVLTDYRDGIQWVRDAAVRAANRGEPSDEIAAAAGLPPHLAKVASLAELYGQVDWSARAIYDNNLGWFDGRPEALYPVPPVERARRQVALMGGVARVMDEAARARGEHTPSGARWAVELVATARRSALATGDEPARLDRAFVEALSALAAGVTNTNGRAYLLESAYRIEHGPSEPPPPVPDDALVDAIPVPLLFTVMATRLIPERSLDAHESVRFEIDGAPYVITVRRGIAERVAGEPLAGTPPPLATVRSDAATWRRLALGSLAPAAALASGRLHIDGDALGFYRFMERFEKGT